MTSKSAINRTDFVRQNRGNRTSNLTRTRKPAATSRQSYRTETLFLPVKPQIKRTSQSTRTIRSTSGSNRARSYDIAFRLGSTDVRAPAIGLPNLDFSNPRWISGLIAAVLSILLLMMWNSSLFTVFTAVVTGNQRLGVEEINTQLGIVGEPVFKAVPEQITENLRLAFPDLENVHVRVGLPNRVIVQVIERTPVVSWFQEGAMTWIDANGIAFMPRGEVPGLVQVAANAAPSDILGTEDEPSYEHRFIDPGLIQVIKNMAGYVPSGVPMIFDPQYGIGWQEPRGWVVYFGQNSLDIPVKLSIYQSLVDKLITQGIQPTLISMEHLDAPFYK